MGVRRTLVGLTFCICYLAFYLLNKYVLSVLKFTYPTLFQGWQTFVGAFLLHVSWKLGWVEINCSSRSDISTWLPASMVFVGIIYAGSRALSRLAVPVFLTLHNVAEVIVCGYQKCFWKETIEILVIFGSEAFINTLYYVWSFTKNDAIIQKTSPAKTCSVLFLLAAAGCLPFNDAQFDPDGYFWAVIHIFCVGSYKLLRKSPKPSTISDIDQQYLNYIFSVALLTVASHPTGDLSSVLDFPFLSFYRFHGSCCARISCAYSYLRDTKPETGKKEEDSLKVSGILGFFLMLTTVKLKSLLAPGQCEAWIFFAKVVTAGLSVLLFDVVLSSATVGCLLLGGLGEALLVFSERKVSS